MLFGRILISILAICLSIISLGYSQGLVTQPFPENGPLFSLHVQHGNFVKSQRYDFPSGAFEFSALLPIADQWIAYGYLPIGVTTSEYVNGTVFGNITVGFGTGLRIGDKGMIVGSLLATLKTMPGLEGACGCTSKYWAMYAGWYSDFYHGERFSPNYWSLGPNLQFRYQASPAVTLYTEVWPYWFIPDGPWGHSDLWMQNGFGLNAGFKQVRGIAEYVTSYWISGNEPRPAIKYQDAVGIGLQGIFDPLRPTLYYQFMLNKEFRKATNGTFGLKLDFIWPSKND
jgi:hypothetical protein